VVGVAVGVTSGYLGGRVDELLNLLTNVVLVIPNLPLMLVLAAFVGEAGPMTIAVIIGLTAWGWGARVTRAQTLSLRQRDYILASELLGENGQFKIVPPRTEGVTKKLTSRRVSAFASWQSRFFRLSSGSPAVLSYWRKQSHVDNSPTAGSWLCADMISVETHPKNPLRFNIVLKNRTIQLQAATADECTHWVQVLNAKGVKILGGGIASRTYSVIDPRPESPKARTVSLAEQMQDRFVTRSATVSA